MKQLTPQEQQTIEEEKKEMRKIGMPEKDIEIFLSHPYHVKLVVRGFPEMKKYKLVAEVVKSVNCRAEVGQKFIFTSRGKLLPDESDCPLCIRALAPMGQILFGFWDRFMEEGIELNEGMWDHFQCLDPGIERGGRGNVLFKVYAKKIE